MTENNDSSDLRCPCGLRHVMTVDDTYAPGVRLYVCPDRPQYAFGRWEDREAVQRAIDARGQLYALVTLSPDGPEPPIPTVIA